MKAMDPRDPQIQLPVVVARNEEIVRGRFWNKLRLSLARVPFAHDLLAAYYCAIDPRTPARVKAVLLAALAYFVLPADVIPDFIAGLGFTDDLTVLAGSIALVREHLTPLHWQRAAQYFSRENSAPR